MRSDSPSNTAAWVAYARGMGHELRPDGRLVEDPYGVAFERGRHPRLHFMIERSRVPVHQLGPVQSVILYMQVRTRVIDDAVRAFCAAGGQQLVMLGAGYDCRALRLPELAGCRVFEVDHPATQSHKRSVLHMIDAVSPAHYVTWDFERPMAELPAVLARAGLDLAAPVFTIWEGVTMYLTPPAIDASLRAIRTWSAPGSRLALTYFTRSRIERPSLVTRALKAVVATVGEPWRFGWTPAELAPYLAERGFTVVTDRAISDAARDLLPADLAAQVGNPDRRFAVAGPPESIAVAS